MIRMVGQTADKLADFDVTPLAAALSHDSRIPLYEQLATAIAQMIRRGELAPDTLFPAEPELARALGVSRQTVHQALAWLARRGLVTRRRGVGTRVAEPYIEQSLDNLYSFLLTLTAQGRLTSARMLGARLTVDAEASALLTGRDDGIVFEVTRIRSVEQEPLVLETIFLMPECGEQLPLERITTEPLYALMRQHCGTEVTAAEETMQPIVVSQPEAALLGLASGDPAFLVLRTGLAGDRPVEFRRSLIRGDRYRFRVHLTGPQLAAP